MGLAASGGAVTLYIKVRAKNRKAEKIMENLSRFDPTWSLADFDRHIQNMFYTVQEAWAPRDPEIARRYLSRELFEKYQIKSQWMIMRHEQNILQNQKLLAALPVACLLYTSIPGQLQMLLLVQAYRHHVRLVGQDIRRHQAGIGEQANVNVIEMCIRDSGGPTLI